MKPPRVISHRGYFYITYYISGERHAIKEPVGVKVDIPKGTGDWWKKSKHRQVIKQRLEDAQTRKLRYKHGHEFVEYRTRFSVRSLDDLLEEYNEEQRMSKGKDPTRDTLNKRRNAVKSLQRFIPNVTLRFSRKQAAEYRDWAYTQYEPSTVESYIVVLRALFAFALTKKLVRENPLYKISVSVPEKEVRHIPRSEQIKVFDAVFAMNPDMFWQVMFLRLSGYRTLEACNLKKSHVRTDRIMTEEVKMKRMDVYPITEAVRIILDAQKDNGQYIFRYRTRKATTGALHDACKLIGVPIWGSHQLKRDYAEEVAPYCRGDAYLKNLMLHHRSKWMTMVADTRYIGADLKLMKKTADKAQGFWIEYLKNKVTELQKSLTKQGNNRVTDFKNGDFGAHDRD